MTEDLTKIKSEQLKVIDENVQLKKTNNELLTQLNFRIDTLLKKNNLLTSEIESLKSKNKILIQEKETNENLLNLSKIKKIEDEENNKLIININDKKILVYHKDFPKTMNWEEAKKACENLGEGWRLPNNEELKAAYMQLHLKGLGGFYLNDESVSDYWSIEEDKSESNEAYFFCIANGLIQNTADSNGRDKEEEYNVRAVRLVN